MLCCEGGEGGWALLNFIFYSNSQEDTFAPSQEYNNAQLITFEEENYSAENLDISFHMDTNINMKYLHQCNVNITVNKMQI